MKHPYNSNKRNTRTPEYTVSSYIVFLYAPKVCFHSSLWSTTLYGYIVIFAYFKLNISVCFTLELKVLKVGRLIASSIVHMNTCQNKFGILQVYIMFKIVGEIFVSCSWNKLHKNREYILKGYAKRYLNKKLYLELHSMQTTNIIRHTLIYS